MKLYHINKTAFLAFLLAFFVFTPTPSEAQVSPTGNLQNYNALLTAGNQEYLVGRNRATLNLDIPLPEGGIYLSNEIMNTYTESANDFSYELNEAYVDLFFGSTDLRIGKQIITQGRADGVFIRDIMSPLDLSEFLTQSVEYIKMGVPAIKATRYFGSNYLEVIATPVFQSNDIAPPGTRWFPFGRTEQNFPVQYADSSITKNQKLFQGSLRLALRESLKWNLDLYAMLWSEGSPSFKKELVVNGAPAQPSVRLKKAYLRRPVIGYSGNYIVSDKLILKSESAFHFRKYADYLPETLRNTDFDNLTPLEFTELSKQFNENEDGFLETKKWLISMIGLQYSLWDWTLTGQLINEHIFDYETKILQQEDFMYSTLQVRRNLMRDKLQLSLFGRYNFSGKDFWLNPEATYEISDSIESGLGLHLFGGNEYERYYGHFSFHDYKSNSFGYIRLTAYF